MITCVLSQYTQTQSFITTLTHGSILGVPRRHKSRTDASCQWRLDTILIKHLNDLPMIFFHYIYCLYVFLLCYIIICYINKKEIYIIKKNLLFPHGLILYHLAGCNMMVNNTNAVDASVFTMHHYTYYRMDHYTYYHHYTGNIMGLSRHPTWFSKYSYVMRINPSKGVHLCINLS